MFHLSHFHRLVSFCWFGFGCWGGFVCFAFAFFLSTDQSVRSSCQPMTSLAYFHDCHCRYDERSIVQKKTFLHQLEHLLHYLLDRPAAMNPQVIQIQSDLLILWLDRSKVISSSPPGCCCGKMQSDLPEPSLLKRARASGTSFGRSPLESLLAGFLLLFLILDELHLAHPSLDLLAWSDHWLCFYFDTSWCSSTCCLAGPHYILEKNY